MKKLPISKKGLKKMDNIKKRSSLDGFLSHLNFVRKKNALICLTA